MAISVIKDNRINSTHPYVTAKCSVYHPNISSGSSYVDTNLWRPVVSSWVKIDGKWKFVQGFDAKVEWIVDIIDDNAGGVEAYLGGGWLADISLSEICYFGKLLDGSYVIKLLYVPPEDGTVGESQYETEISYSSYLKVNAETGAVSKFCPNEVASGAAGMITSKKDDYYPDVYLGESYGSYHYAFGGSKYAIFNETTGNCISVSSGGYGFHSLIYKSGSYVYGIYNGNLYRGTLGGTSITFTKLASDIASKSKLILIDSYLYVVEPNSSSSPQRILKYNLSGSLQTSITLSTTYTDTDGSTKYKGKPVTSLATDGTYLYLYLRGGGTYHEAHELYQYSDYNDDVILKYNSNLSLISSVELDFGRFRPYIFRSMHSVSYCPKFFVQSGLAFNFPCSIDLSNGKVNPFIDKIYYRTPFKDHFGNTTSYTSVGYNSGNGGITLFELMDTQVNNEGIRETTFIALSSGDVYKSGTSYTIYGSPKLLKLSIREV